MQTHKRHVIRRMMNNQPLWLPKGSVRAILAILIASTACLMAWYSKPMPEWFSWAVRLILIAYFAQKYLDKFAENKKENNGNT
uniref:Uncharacterized protein n=1 Tax=viral metagenome TaxID=1070528 RepID=A0A6M3Y6I9_9ZZZZ